MLKITRVIRLNTTSQRKGLDKLPEAMRVPTVYSPILNGMQIFHNYVRPHEGLDGRTPSEMAGIEVQGENRWMTLIQNSTRNRLKLKEQNKKHEK